MPDILVSITLPQHRALRRKVKLAGKGTIITEIRQAIRQHLAGPRYKGDLKESKQTRKQARPPRRVTQPHLIGLASMAVEVLGSAEKANDWFYCPNQLLKNCTPVSLLGTAAGVKHVIEILHQKSQASQKTRAVTRKVSQRPATTTTVTRKVALRRADDPPVSGLMALYAQVAAKWGKVDPNDKTAVQHFFENVLPTFKPSTQQAIVDELFFRSLTLPSHGGCGQEDE